jgi:adenylate kinase family enzyme
MLASAANGRRAAKGSTTVTARRIFVTGQGGSGKTTLARQLAARLDLPTFSFDDVAYDPRTHRRRADDLRRADAARIAALPAWVVDCWYMGWTTPLLDRADLIVWLDLPWRIAALRIVLRHLKAELRRNNPHPGWRNLWHFLRSERARYVAPPSSAKDVARDDGANNRAATARLLAPYGAKVVRCRRPADVAALLDSVQGDALAP